MSVHDRRRLPIGRNFEVLEGVDVQIEPPIPDNAGNDLDLTKVTAASWKAQPSMDDDTNAVEKTMGAGIVFELRNAVVYATIQIDAGDTVGLPGASKYVTWVHRLLVTYDGQEYPAMMGNMRVFNGW